MITHDEKLLDKFDFIYKIHQMKLKKLIKIFKNLQSF